MSDQPAVDPKATREIKKLDHASPLLSCRFDPTGRYVFAGAEDYLLHRWELASGTKTELAGHESWVKAIGFAPDASITYSGGYDGRVLAWPTDAEKPAPKFAWEAHQGWVRSLAVSKDGQQILTGGNDNLVKLWSADGKLLREFVGHPRHVYSVAFAPDGKHILSADLMGKIKQWEIESGREVRELDAAILSKYDEGFRANIGGVKAFEFSPDGRLLACSGITDVSNAFAGLGKPMIVLLDWETGKAKDPLRPKDDITATAWRPMHHPSGFLFAVGGGHGGGALWFWKPEETASFHIVKLPADARDMDLHKDQAQVAIAHADKTLRIFSLLPS